MANGFAAANPAAGSAAADLVEATEHLALIDAKEVAVPIRPADWVAHQFSQLGHITPPAGRRRKIIITGFSRFGFWAKAKVYQGDYFPAFTRRMAELDVDCHFVWNEDGLEQHLTGKECAILHLFNEEKPWTYNARIRAAEARAGLVFCTRRAANIIARKPVANRFLTARGIAMPAMIEAPGSDAKVFSNASMGSGKRIMVLDQSAELDGERYNTAFVDTRLSFEGETYYTMFRIQAVSRKVLHAYVRARNVKEKSPSVHSKDTPVNAGLIEHLYAEQVASRWDEIVAFTDRIGRVLGPGCYAHDMIVAASTGAMFMVESGFKFNDSPYAGYLEPIKDQIPCNAIFYGGEYPVRAADLFLQEWDWVLENSQPDPSGMAR